MRGRSLLGLVEDELRPFDRAQIHEWVGTFPIGKLETEESDRLDCVESVTHQRII
jgi:hypothetical protein